MGLFEFMGGSLKKSSICSCDFLYKPSILWGISIYGNPHVDTHPMSLPRGEATPAGARQRRGTSSRWCPGRCCIDPPAPKYLGPRNSLETLLWEISCFPDTLSHPTVGFNMNKSWNHYQVTKKYNETTQPGSEPVSILKFSGHWLFHYYPTISDPLNHIYIYSHDSSLYPYPLPYNQFCWSRHSILIHFTLWQSW